MKLGDFKTNVLLLGAGTALLVLSQVRFGVGLLAWFAPIPFLVFLRTTSGRLSRFVFAGVLCLAWCLATAKYMTPPFPKILILVNGLTYAAVALVGYILWDRLRRDVPPVLANLAFPAVLVSIEWLQYTFTPLAPNGGAAYAQLENLTFLQTASLFGISGISFLVYWFAAVAAQAVCEGVVPWRQAAVVAGIVVAAHIYGAFRIGSSAKAGTVRVAAVGTDFDWFGEAVPRQEERARIVDALFARTDEAAGAGAKLIVWNEVSTIVLAEEEPAFLARARDAAQKGGVHLVVSYLMPLTLEPFLVENKYVWLAPSGEVIDTYLKARTLPGEPSRPGDGVAKVVETGFGKATGAICYDFDFPQVGLDRARQGADIVFVPSSDMPGVDPFHSQIAAVRAIEGGYSVLRSTRMGLSGAIDSVGRFRGWLSANETEDRVLLAQLPVGRRWTLYSVVGDVVAYLSVGLALLALIVGLRSRRLRQKLKTS